MRYRSRLPSIAECPRVRVGFAVVGAGTRAWGGDGSRSWGANSWRGPGVFWGMVEKPLTLGLLLAVVAIASAQNATSLAQGLANAEAKAILKGDAGWYRTHLAPEYKATSKTGKTKNKTQEIAEFSAMSKGVKVTSVVPKVTKAAMTGDRMATTTDVKLAATMKGPDGKPHVLKVAIRAATTWTKRGGVWTKRTERTVSEKATMDGRPI